MKTPTTLIIMDGFGLSSSTAAGDNAIAAAAVEADRPKPSMIISVVGVFIQIPLVMPLHGAPTKPEFGFVGKGAAAK